MKKTVLSLLFLTILSLTAQAQSIKLGIKGGINYANQTGSDITITTQNYKSEAITNYHIGLLAEIKLLENFAIQPELLYSTKGASYKYALTEFKNELGYITIPVLLKFGLSKSLSLELGPQAGFLLSEKNNVDFKDSETFEFSAVGGLGLKITKNLFIQARYGLGLTNATKNAEIKNSVVQVSAGILF
jgi:hypothetical protein